MFPSISATSEVRLASTLLQTARALMPNVNSAARQTNVPRFFAHSARRSMVQPNSQNNIITSIGSRLKNAPLSQQSRSYIKDPNLAKIIDESSLNKLLRQAFKFQMPGNCLQNTNAIMQRFLGAEKKDFWQRADLITEQTTPAVLKDLCETSGPIKLTLYGAGRGYATFHVLVLAGVREVNGQYVGVVYDGNDRDKSNPVLQDAKKLAAQLGRQNGPHDLTADELHDLDPHAQAFPATVDLGALLRHNLQQYEGMKKQLDADGVDEPLFFPPPQFGALNRLPKGVVLADQQGMLDEVEEYVKENPQAVQTNFPFIGLTEYQEEVERVQDHQQAGALAKKSDVKPQG